MIASRYQGTKNTASGRMDGGDGPIEAKRARVESGESWCCLSEGDSQSVVVSNLGWVE